MTHTADLRHTRKHGDDEGNAIRANIRLNDECRNGHEDFSLTGDIYEKFRDVGGGCIHNEITEIWPEMQIFADLHLCDWKGAPMHAAGNGRYHLQNGMNQKDFCRYFNCTPEQYQILKSCALENDTVFKFYVQKLGIPEQWKERADKGISILENLTGQKFESKATRSNFTPLTPEEFDAMRNAEKRGEFTAAKVAQREKAKQKVAKLDKLDKLKNAYLRKLEVAKIDYLLDVELINRGVSEFSAIFYNHTNEIDFNWSDMHPIKPDFIQEFKDDYQAGKMKIPAGLTIIDKKPR